jgi:hypothetical protein
MRIRKRHNNCTVELDDGSAWRIWPDDVERINEWTHVTRLSVHRFDGSFCTHVLLERLTGICVRVIDAAEHWPSESIRVHDQVGFAA